ncbi:hypothetical protein [Lentzea kentuckyensis]|uniref:hypothetical protein n=1 Tax=Lentzea kentuckyensis TaxID=360086 RepID=UPI000A36D694|nr:hypothetical protein [Lentzea kentuckyensis]
MPNQDLPLRAEFRGLPDIPADQVVTGLIPLEPPHFQTPPALELLSAPISFVTGQRGVGKTQLAGAYARQRVRDGWLVAWVGAETEDQIKAGLAELADRLGLSRPEDPADVTAARVRNHMQTRPGPALLVFDNAVSLDSVLRYVPRAGAAHVVITSTARGTQVGNGDVLVDVFDEKTALRFLHEATGLTDDSAAAELAQEVGRLPLALAQAAARIKTAGWSYPDYLARFRRFPVEKHLGRRDGDPYPLGAATAILVALEPFQGSEILETLALLAPEGVSRGMLDRDADDELAQLYESSLVEYTAWSGVRTHRLVQRVIRDSCRAAGTYDNALERTADLIRSCLDGLRLYRAAQLESTTLARHAEVLCENAKGQRLEREITSVALETHLWVHRARHQAALAWVEMVVTINPEQPHAHVVAAFEQVFDDTKQALGLDDRDTLKAAVALARAYARAGRHEDVIEILDEARTAPGFSWNSGDHYGESGQLYSRAVRERDRDIPQD